MKYSFQEFGFRYRVATCCLFLAGKVEDGPKKCKDIVATARTLMKTDKIANGAYKLNFGEMGYNKKLVGEKWKEISEANHVVQAMEQVKVLEPTLLKAINFQFIIEHPYRYLTEYSKKLDSLHKNDKRTHENIEKVLLKRFFKKIILTDVLG